MTPEQKQAFRREIFTSRPDSPCEHCGGYHLRACGRVKRIALYGNGNTQEIEYWGDSQWDQGEVIWPEDAFEEDD